MTPFRDLLHAANLRHGTDGFTSPPKASSQSLYRLATDWTVRRSNPGGGEIFRTRPDRHWGPPSLLYSGYRVFPGGKAAGASTHPLLAARSRMSRAIPLLPLWAIGAFYRANFTFTFYFAKVCHSGFVHPLCDLISIRLRLIYCDGLCSFCISVFRCYSCLLFNHCN
jgi:hypothetical protein